MSTQQQLQKQVKRTGKRLAAATTQVKTAVKRQVKKSAAQVSKWSTAKKVGVAAAVVAVPLMAAAISHAVAKSRAQAANGKGSRKNRKPGAA